MKVTDSHWHKQLAGAADGARGGAPPVLARAVQELRDVLPVPRRRLRPGRRGARALPRRSGCSTFITRHPAVEPDELLHIAPVFVHDARAAVARVTRLLHERLTRSAAAHARTRRRSSRRRARSRYGELETSRNRLAQALVEPAAGRATASASSLPKAPATIAAMLADAQGGLRVRADRPREPGLARRADRLDGRRQPASSSIRRAGAAPGRDLAEGGVERGLAVATTARRPVDGRDVPYELRRRLDSRRCPTPAPAVDVEPGRPRPHPLHLGVDGTAEGRADHARQRRGVPRLGPAATSGSRAGDRHLRRTRRSTSTSRRSTSTARSPPAPSSTSSTAALNLNPHGLAALHPRGGADAVVLGAVDDDVPRLGSTPSRRAASRRCAACSAAARCSPRRCSRHWMTRLPHARFTNLYGPTEATIASSYYTSPSCPPTTRSRSRSASALRRRGAGRARRGARPGADGRDRRPLHRRRRPQPRATGETRRRRTPRSSGSAPIPSGASTAPATSRGSATTALSTSSGGRTRRSRAAATGSSSARSRPR